MPERSFGRTIRFRRTKLGLSQTKLGELVGRSPSTIRAWERDDSTPNDPDVLMALAAVLGVEQRTLFEKAGVNRPEVETSPTLEQELATLRPPVEGGEEIEVGGVEISFSYHELAGLGVALGHDEVPAPVAEVADDVIVDENELAVGPEESAPGAPFVDALSEAPAPEAVAAEDSAPEAEPQREELPVPAFTEPSAPYVVTRLAPTHFDPAYAEPSYVEDRSERQLYRVRTVATGVGVVVMLLLLMYALGEGLESFSEWWDSFFGQLRL